MGSRNPDRIPFAVYAARAPTIGDMLRLGWTVYLQCDSCGLQWKVSLKLLARLLGRGAELWDRHPNCIKRGCSGGVTYWGTPPGLRCGHALIAAERDRDDGL